MTLKEMYQKVEQKKSIEIKLNELYHQRNDLEKHLLDLKDILNKEQLDVDRLEKGGLVAFFYEMSGKIDHQLEKERQEAYLAKSKFDSANYQMNTICNDILHYESQLESLKHCEQEYQTLFQQTLHHLKPNYDEIATIEQQIIHCQVTKKEIEEAINAGNKAYQVAKEAHNHLNSADGWGAFDLLGGGLLADVVKYSHIDQAESLIQELQVQLSRFQTELADVEIQTQVEVRIDNFLRFADYFFDGFFADLTVMSKISNSIDQIKTVKYQINQILEHLDDLKKVQQQQEQQLQQQLTQFIMEREN